MTDRDLVQALRARDPGALASLYDAHAEGVYRFCWFLLGAESAQVALRDTMIAAEAHIEALRDPDRLYVWLLALARAECRRRRQSDPPAEPEEAPDAAAWHAVHGLPADDREILELSLRHGLAAADLGAVLGLSARHAEALRESASLRLQDAITAEVLARRDPGDCPARSVLVADAEGGDPDERRARVVNHIFTCETCRPHRARQVSAGKVFALLPLPVVPDTVRVRVMSCFIDPELLAYRRYVARRAGPLDAQGFPGGESRRGRHVVVGALAAVVAAAVVVALVMQVTGEPMENRGSVVARPVLTPTTPVSDYPPKVPPTIRVLTPVDEPSPGRTARPRPRPTVLGVHYPRPERARPPRPTPSRTARTRPPVPRPSPTPVATVTPAVTVSPVAPVDVDLATTTTETQEQEHTHVKGERHGRRRLCRP
ncbi:RNA polymerase sigma factor [Herbidospora cretacea]|uniref:RNA polymerase sigma factor n=1 Tax=Herbidospora cretacea TaxID=28444 RepID=UPI000773F6E7|nr:sigma-70 family RNA polymerase sigma factor [Herbidospora cretacea]